MPDVLCGFVFRSRWKRRLLEGWLGDRCWPRAQLGKLSSSKAVARNAGTPGKGSSAQTSSSSALASISMTKFLTRDGSVSTCVTEDAHTHTDRPSGCAVIVRSWAAPRCSPTGSSTTISTIRPLMLPVARFCFRCLRVAGWGPEFRASNS